MIVVVHVVDDDSKVEDRTDGKLVHLDGLNFSRAWGLYRFPPNYTKYRFPLNDKYKYKIQDSTQ